MILRFSLIALLLFCTLKTYAQSEQPSSPYPFQLTLFRPDSSAVSSTRALPLGKPVILAFWLTTCMPCMAELAAYTERYAAWKQQKDFELIAISIDFPNRFRQIEPLVKEKKWPFPVFWERERTFKNILPGGLNGLPQVFVFDASGQLVYHHKGYYPGFENELFAQLK
ncbi:MAG: TlpA family protein disulfide reductase [Bacteroidetes bacterium]|nr:TlpA family protein disulfide reductase [Bacteroidota bacterium]